MNELRVRLLDPLAKLPRRSTSGSAGYDLSARLERDVLIAPGETTSVGCGFALALEKGYAAFIYARSGLGIMCGVTPANCVGVVDSDYRGEVIVGLRNASSQPFMVRDGDRIAQMVIAGYETPELVLCDDLDKTQRGAGGFGSSGLR
ncbi:dUTP diphosphatase [Gordonibacter massiliensis (ex Traore et al. 2017)]|uniref:dUTP diphosphatase n=1 Tax=Gordonibacter massiliensis (ex Traore et al. 2017) TaxID=1841863 RepID=A0A842JG64_9ACTN|nr:dUTP diphosphatase [Gordonibacter massiliensis (ex Traore et al. 2017)]MBC2889986.1 dUTP diphosphatase [Gordonibacter massiliensis (ex Traore et al. 2017)]